MVSGDCVHYLCSFMYFICGDQLILDTCQPTVILYFGEFGIMCAMEQGVSRFDVEIITIILCLVSHVVYYLLLRWFLGKNTGPLLFYITCVLMSSSTFGLIINFWVMFIHLVQLNKQTKTSSPPSLKTRLSAPGPEWGKQVDF